VLARPDACRCRACLRRHHRHHHQYSDEEPDLHSPGLRGFYWSHVGWILAPDYEETQYKRIPDMAKYPELMWLNRYHLVPGITLAVVLFAIGGLPLLAWGFFLSTVACWHCTFMINSLTHMFGRRRWPTTDDSRNSLILALLTMGEGGTTTTTTGSRPRARASSGGDWRDVLRCARCRPWASCGTSRSRPRTSSRARARVAA
jgi:hypothetical protein